MKFYLLNLCLILMLVSCGGSAEDNDNSSESKDTNGDETSKEFDYSNLDIFVAYAEVSRYEDPEEHNFEIFNYDDIFYYQFPHEAEFNRTKKTDHVTYYADEVVEGSQYVINVDDYTKSDEGILIDAEFTKYIHDAFVAINEPEIVHERELTHLPGVFGYYSVYTYAKNKGSYTADYAHFGFDRYIVGLCITGTPYGESRTIVGDYIGLFRPVGQDL